MKKFLSLFFPCLILLFDGCSTSISQENYFICDSYDEIEFISEDNLEKYIDNAFSFVLYVGNQSCSTCDIIKRSLNEIVDRYHIVLFQINHTESNFSYQDIKDKYNFPSFNIDEVPAFLFINQGNLSSYFTYYSIYLSKFELENKIFSYGNFSSLKIINEIDDEGSFKQNDFSLADGKYLIDDLTSPSLYLEYQDELSDCNLYFYQTKNEIDENLFLPCYIEVKDSKITYIND